jgi:hypothetical protein
MVLQYYDCKTVVHREVNLLCQNAGAGGVAGSGQSILPRHDDVDRAAPRARRGHEKTPPSTFAG